MNFVLPDSRLISSSKGKNNGDHFLLSFLLPPSSFLLPPSSSFLPFASLFASPPHLLLFCFVLFSVSALVFFLVFSSLSLFFSSFGILHPFSSPFSPLLLPFSPLVLLLFSFSFTSTGFLLDLSLTEFYFCFLQAPIFFSSSSLSLLPSCLRRSFPPPPARLL